MKLVIVESPFKGDDYSETSANILYARAAVRDCLLRGEAPIASHLLYTQEGILDDTILDERKLGIEAGLLWGSHAEKTVVYVDRGISEGMKHGIQRAHNEGREVEYRWIERCD